MHAERIASRIEEVTVYAGAARVRRRAEVEVGGGPSVVRVGGLPLALRDASVRLAAEGPVIAADVRVVVEIPEEDASLPPADPEELDAARLEVAQLEAELARLNAVLDALATLQPGARKRRDEQAVPAWSEAVAARLGVVELRAEREREVRAAMIEVQTALVQARRRRARAEDAFRRATTARNARPDELRKALVVTLRPSGEGGRGVLAVEYVVPGARWAPSYVARLGDGEARLELRAVIAQQTGEDWNGVKLALSTADAQSWTELPELPSLRIGRRQPPPLRAGWKPPPAGAEQLYADWDAAFARHREKLLPPPAHTLGLDTGEVMRGGHDEFEEHEVTSPYAEEQTAVFAAPPRIGAPQGAAAPGYGAPPPMPPAAPAPMAMPMMQAAPAPKSRGVASAIGGVLAAPVALAAAGAGAMRDAVRRSEPERAKKSLARHQAPADDDSSLEADTVVPADLLAYGDLRMPPPTSPERGHLVHADRRDLYLAVMVSQRVTVQFDVLVAIAQAERRADRVVTLPTPPGTEGAWPDTYDFAFRADGTVEVPSDGVWHGVALGSRAAKVTVKHVVVPRESTDVFRVATLDNPHDAPLLPGPIDVYDGPDFVLTSHVDFTSPRGALELGLGVDQRVKSARRTKYREETAGMLRGSLRLEHEVEIDVENVGARPVDVEVRERVPVRAVEEDDDVEIGVDRVTPAWEPWEPEPESPGEPRLRGGHRWRVPLGAGEKKSLALAYHVKIAAKHELVGGNRRDA
jgi:hypothetical protein